MATQGVAVPLSHLTEFIYAYGTLGDEVVAASNRGGVHAFSGGTWKQVRAPDGKSFQSSKTGRPFEPKFEFLSGDRHLEYGRVYRHRRPGCLAAPLNWKDGSTRLEFRIEANRIEVRQDGAVIAATAWPQQHPAQSEHSAIRRGKGVFGDFTGRIVDETRRE